MGTNAMILASLGIIFLFGGLAPILWIFFPTLCVAATLGVWLFYVQHQFEDTHWDTKQTGRSMKQRCTAVRIMICQPF